MAPRKSVLDNSILITEDWCFMNESLNSSETMAIYNDFWGIDSDFNSWLFTSYVFSLVNSDKQIVQSMSENYLIKNYFKDFFFNVQLCPFASFVSCIYMQYFFYQTKGSSAIWGLHQLFSYLWLFLKSFSLHHWIVQLCIGVTYLLLTYKQLKPLCQSTLWSVPEIQ